jgi:hypothetical protein
MVCKSKSSAGRLLRLAVLGAAAVIVAAACGAATGGKPTPTPSSTASAPSFQVLTVQGFKGSAAAIGLYDSTTDAWRTISTGSSADQPRFATPGRVAYLAAGGIYSENLDGSDRRTEVSGNISDFAFRVDGTIASISPVPPLNDRSRLTIQSPSGQTATADIGVATGIGGFVPQRRLEFSPDGKLLLLVEPSVADPYLQVRALDGSLRLAPPTGPFVSGGGAAWSAGSQLSFSNGSGLQEADLATGSTRTVLPSVHAWNPVTSPDGRYVVYEQRDPQPDQLGGYGPSRLQLFDGSAGKVVDGVQRDGGTLARFVSPTEFFFSSVTGAAAPIYRYDVANKTERSTGMSGFVTDVRWLNAR